MPIAINGSGTITGISVGGIPDGTVDTDVLAANAVTFAKIGTTEQGQLCKAWVNFNGTSTVAIRASYNVSSITDNGTGDYTVNFTSAMADANYGLLCTSEHDNGTANYVCNLAGDIGPASGSARINNLNSTTAAFADSRYVYVAIFR
jgi:hypothetical protein